MPLAFDSYPLKRYLLDRSRGKIRDYEPFFYETQITLAGLAADTVGVIQLDMDAPFLWLRCVGELAGGNDATVGDSTHFDVTVVLRIGGPGSRSLSKTPMHYDNIFTRRPWSFPLPAPYLLPAGGQVHITLNAQTNNGPIAFPWRARPMLVGLKCFGWGKA